MPLSQDQDSIWLVNEKIGKVVFGHWTKSTLSKIQVVGIKNKIAKSRSTQHVRWRNLQFLYHISLLKVQYSIHVSCKHRLVGLHCINADNIYIFIINVLILSLLLGLFDRFNTKINESSLTLG